MTPWTAAYQAAPIHGIFQARVLEWDVPLPSPISPIVNVFNVVYINLLFFYKHMPKGNSLPALLATIFKIIYNH